MDLVDRALAGDRRSLSRLLTFIENESPAGREALKKLYPRTGRAHIVGITGSPGSGKSTLVNHLALEYRKRGKTVGIVAVDPSSPISGGAVLGDRVRMQELFADSGIFIRSMASRDALGGLATTTSEVISVLDATGRDIVIVETVGVGQAEVDIVREAHTTIVVLVPGMGDDIQAMKAGLMEIADLFVVNKADRDGADAVVSQVRYMLSLAPPSGRKTPILKTVATTGQGIPELADAIAEHYRYLESTDGLQKHAENQARRHLIELVRTQLLTTLTQRSNEDGSLDAVAAKVAARENDPYTAADELLARLLPHQ